MKTINAATTFTTPPRRLIRRLLAWYIKRQMRMWESVQEDLVRQRHVGIEAYWRIEEEQNERRLRLRELEQAL
jgi:hypothetical protein